jgi:DNA-binding transcriptional regulator GbsR (MarR family)
MDERQAQFVEGVGQMLSAQGLPRMAGRMWAWLLICDPAQQTAAQLAHALHASRGSISDSARLLTSAGLISRTTRAGDRREYFSIPVGAVRTLMQGRMPGVIAMRRLMDEGLELLADHPPDQRARVQEVHDVYAFFERELPAMLERFEAEQHQRRGQLQT